MWRSGPAQERLADHIDRRALDLVERLGVVMMTPASTTALTDAGRDLVPVLMALTAWGDRWVAPAQGRPLRFRHTECDSYFTPAVHCSECHEPMTAETVDVRPGPGGRAGPGTRLIAKVMRAKR